jgi:glycosyltransferase involved in cell wall biosynthesis
MYFIGDGPLFEELAKAIKTYKLESNVVLTGYVNEPIQYFQRSKYTIMCSKSEGLPTSLLQSMSCECIPITNLVGNIEDVVNDMKNAILLQDNSIDAISAGIKKAYNLSSKETRDISKNARQEIISNFAHNASASKWQEILKNEFT